MHIAVTLGVAIATAVLTGALIVGDSVRGSLRHLALDRLQQIDFALTSDRYFRADLADELAKQPEFVGSFSHVAPISLLSDVTVEAKGSGRNANVLLVGADERFWDFCGDDQDAARPKQLPGDGEIVLNEPLATRLGVFEGDLVVIRLPTADQVPADSPLGRKNNRVRNVANLRVTEVIPAVSLGRFRLRSNQQQPFDAFVALSTIDQALDQAGGVNGLLVSAGDRVTLEDPNSPTRLHEMLTPTLADYGIDLERIRRRFSAPDDSAPTTIADFFQLTQDRMVFDDITAAEIRTAVRDLDPEEMFAYLATSIETTAPAGTSAETPSEPRHEPSSEISTGAASPRSIPYSIVTAIDDRTADHFLKAARRVDLSDANDRLASERLEEDEVILNSWSAEDLQVHVGDRVTIRYFEPETTHDRPREAAATFRVRAIVPLTEPKQPYRRRRPAVYDSMPSVANDPDLTPRVEGVTDEASIADWDPPFPFDQSRVRDEDDTYWDNHRTTPKAFIPLATGQRLWGSRFGRTTSFRVNPALTSEQELRASLLSQLKENEHAFAFRPVKTEALLASSGTTPFQFLFLGFSMFLIASALMLVALLFRLGMEIRASEFGLLRAVGFGIDRTRILALCEASVMALIGAAFGVGFGVLYAWGMLAGLRTWWLDAVVTPFLNLYISWTVSIPIGFALGVLSGLAVVWWSLRQVKSVSPRWLLKGSLSNDTKAAGSKKIRRWWVVLLFVLALLTAMCGVYLQGEAQAGAFFTSGALVLITCLMGTTMWLHRMGQDRRSRSRIGLGTLALRAAARRPTRSALTTSLMAAACFLIIAISAFRLSPTNAGTGGFDWLLESGRPLFVDFTDKSALRRAIGTGANQLAEVTIVPLRVQQGDDASCRNLYRPVRPRILGVTPAMVDYFDRHGGFAWAGSCATTELEKANPWRLLTKSAPAGEAGSAPIPVVLDKNTAMYSLRLYGGIGQEFTLDYGLEKPVRFQVVGLLGNSILQGSLLVSEASLLSRFPNVSGYQMFLAKGPAGTEEPIHLLESAFGDQGLEAQSTKRLLADLMAVQNTYLSTFQSLGALGLLLGVVGLAVAQTRNVLERRGEFALLRATGFTSARLGWLVLLENGLLMLIGLGIGVATALITVLPHALVGGAETPWRSLVFSLAAVFAAGMLASTITVRAASGAPIVTALRGQ